MTLQNARRVIGSGMVGTPRGKENSIPPQHILWDLEIQRATPVDSPEEETGPTARPLSLFPGKRVGRLISKENHGALTGMKEREDGRAKVLAGLDYPSPFGTLK
jgi:hypothetical protein